MKKIYIPLSAFFLTACMGSIFGGAPKEVADLDNFQIREASPKESKRFDTCLYRIFREQQRYFSKHQHYSGSLNTLKLENTCRGIRLNLEAAHQNYLVMARIKTGNTMAQWSLNERGEAIEHEDPKMLNSF